MNRYLRTLMLFWSTAIAAEMEYRFNFLIAALSSLGNLIGSIFSLFLFYRVGYNFGGWTWEQAIVVLGIFTVLQGFANTFLTPNLNRIVIYVQQGTLDFVLLKPISSQFWLSARSLSPWGATDIIFGAGLIVYSGSKVNLNISNYAAGIFALGLGLIILYSLWFILGATSIWFVKIYNVTETLRGLLEAGRFPMSAYPAAYRLFFTFIVPVAFLTTIPAEVLLGSSNIEWLLGSIALAIAALLSSRYFWQFALRFYTSASS